MKTSHAITLELASRIPNLSQTKWNKLMFLIDGVGYCQTDKTFTGFEYMKLPYGPVPTDYRDKIREMISAGIVQKAPYAGVTDSVMRIVAVENKKVEATEEMKGENTLLPKVLERIIDIFGKWSAVKLSDFTHELDTWKKPTMFGQIDLSPLKNEYFLKKNFDEANLGALVMS